MEENNKNKKYPFEGNKWLKKNKYGKLEDIEDQCNNETCNCSNNHCLFEEFLWEEHYMYQAYRRNLIAAGSKKKEEGD